MQFLDLAIRRKGGYINGVEGCRSSGWKSPVEVEPETDDGDTVLIFTGKSVDGKVNLYQVNLSNNNTLSQLTQDGQSQSPLLGASGLDNQRAP